ncbi:hypothetical protein HYX00_00950 [Candidatus Woesearchaeota archaeon]|nr:hypothetical protein [Candidatus Woesearchaeota archaeon]
MKYSQIQKIVIVYGTKDRIKTCKIILVEPYPPVNRHGGITGSKFIQ